MEYVIIGAGPAGLQLGYFLAQTGRSYVILEAGRTPGTFFGSVANGQSSEATACVSGRPTWRCRRWNG
jgi:protoporphyrinogen oxidase